MNTNKKNEATLTQVGVSFVIVLLIGWMLWRLLDLLFFGFLVPWVSPYSWLLPIVQVTYVLIICCGVPVAVLAIRVLAMKMAESTNNE